MNTFVNVMHANTCNCATCAPVPTLGIKMSYEEKVKEVTKTKKGPSKLVVGENDLAMAAPKVAAMLSEKDKHFAFEVTAGSNRKLTFVCPDCKQEFKAAVYSVVRSVDKGFTGCTVCAGRKVVRGINDLATKCPEAAAMWSSKNKFSASEVTARCGKKAFFKCRDCGQEFEATIANITKAVDNGTTGCPVCRGLKAVPGINDLASKYPEIAAMWSSKNKLSVSEVTARSGKKAFFKCYDCGQEFEATIANIARAIDNGTTGCPVCVGKKIVSGINDLASQCPEAAAMWSSKNKLSASEVAVKSNQKAFFKCRDCGQEFEATIANITKAVDNGTTGCYDCAMRKSNAISKPEWFYTRLMLAFAGKSGIPNPFFDARCILGENSFMGLDFVDHIQKLIYEYNGNAWHGNDEQAAKDRFKFEAARKAGYAMIRVLEPGLEVLDPKYDIVMPEGFGHHGKYDTEIMEEVGRKVIHLLEEIYGRKASPEIWALNNFKEFEVWYNTNKKELEANALENMLSHKTAAKKAA